MGLRKGGVLGIILSAAASAATLLLLAACAGAGAAATTSTTSANSAPTARFSVVATYVYDEMGTGEEMPEAEGTYYWNPTANGGVGAYEFPTSSPKYFIYQAEDPEGLGARHWFLGMTVGGGEATAIDYEDLSIGGLTALPSRESDDWYYGASVDVGKGGLQLDDPYYPYETVRPGSIVEVSTFDYWDNDGDAPQGDSQGSPTYQWQSATTPEGPYTNINAQPISSYNVPETQSDYWIRCIVTVHAQTGVASGSAPTQPVYISLPMAS